MTWVVVAYALIGIAAGLFAAVRAIQDGIDSGSAGVAALFVACFWPIVALVAAFGIVAFRISRLIGGHR